jgi:hypothetical protein
MAAISALTWAWLARALSELTGAGVIVVVTVSP